MVLVRMLIKCQEYIRLVAGAGDFAGTDAHLKERRAAGNSRGDGHERHDLLLAPSGQPRQETADGLDAVLRITRNPDNGFVDGGNVGRAARGRSGRRSPLNQSELPSS